MKTRLYLDFDGTEDVPTAFERAFRTSLALIDEAENTMRECIKIIGSNELKDDIASEDLQNLNASFDLSLQEIKVTKKKLQLLNLEFTTARENPKEWETVVSNISNMIDSIKIYTDRLISLEQQLAESFAKFPLLEAKAQANEADSRWREVAGIDGRIQTDLTSSKSEKAASNSRTLAARRLVDLQNLKFALVQGKQTDTPFYKETVKLIEKYNELFKKSNDEHNELQELPANKDKKDISSTHTKARENLERVAEAEYLTWYVNNVDKTYQYQEFMAPNLFVVRNPLMSGIANQPEQEKLRKNVAELSRLANSINEKTTPETLNTLVQEYNAYREFIGNLLTDPSPLLDNQDRVKTLEATLASQLAALRTPTPPSPEPEPTPGAADLSEAVTIEIYITELGKIQKPLIPKVEKDLNAQTGLLAALRKSPTPPAEELGKLRAMAEATKIMSTAYLQPPGDPATQPLNQKRLAIADALVSLTERINAEPSAGEAEYLNKHRQNLINVLNSTTAVAAMNNQEYLIAAEKYITAINTYIATGLGNNSEARSILNGHEALLSTSIPETPVPPAAGEGRKGLLPLEDKGQNIAIANENLLARDLNAALHNPKPNLDIIIALTKATSAATEQRKASGGSAYLVDATTLLRDFSMANLQPLSEHRKLQIQAGLEKASQLVAKAKALEEKSDPAEAREQFDTSLRELIAERNTLFNNILGDAFEERKGSLRKDIREIAAFIKGSAFLSEVQTWLEKIAPPFNNDTPHAARALEDDRKELYAQYDQMHKVYLAVYTAARRSANDLIANPPSFKEVREKLGRLTDPDVKVSFQASLAVLEKTLAETDNKEKPLFERATALKNLPAQISALSLQLDIARQSQEAKAIEALRQQVNTVIANFDTHKLVANDSYDKLCRDLIDLNQAANGLATPADVKLLTKKLGDFNASLDAKKQNDATVVLGPDEAQKKAAIIDNINSEFPAPSTLHAMQKLNHIASKEKQKVLGVTLEGIDKQTAKKQAELAGVQKQQTELEGQIPAGAKPTPEQEARLSTLQERVTQLEGELSKLATERNAAVEGIIKEKHAEVDARVPVAEAKKPERRVIFEKSIKNENEKAAARWPTSSTSLAVEAPGDSIAVDEAKEYTQLRERLAGQEVRLIDDITEAATKLKDAHEAEAKAVTPEQREAAKTTVTDRTRDLEGLEQKHKVLAEQHKEALSGHQAVVKAGAQALSEITDKSNNDMQYGKEVFFAESSRQANAAVTAFDAIPVAEKVKRDKALPALISELTTNHNAIRELQAQAVVTQQVAENEINVNNGRLKNANAQLAVADMDIKAAKVMLAADSNDPAALRLLQDAKMRREIADNTATELSTRLSAAEKIRDEAGKHIGEYTQAERDLTTKLDKYAKQLPVPEQIALRERNIEGAEIEASRLTTTKQNEQSNKDATTKKLEANATRIGEIDRIASPTDADKQEKNRLAQENAVLRAELLKVESSIQQLDKNIAAANTRRVDQADALVKLVKLEKSDRQVKREAINKPLELINIQLEAVNLRLNELKPPLPAEPAVAAAAYHLEKDRLERRRDELRHRQDHIQAQTKRLDKQDDLADQKLIAHQTMDPEDRAVALKILAEDKAHLDTAINTAEAEHKQALKDIEAQDALAISARDAALAAKTDPDTTNLRISSTTRNTTQADLPRRVGMHNGDKFNNIEIGGTTPVADKIARIEEVNTRIEPLIAELEAEKKALTAHIADAKGILAQAEERMAVLQSIQKQQQYVIDHADVELNYVGSDPITMKNKALAQERKETEEKALENTNASILKTQAIIDDARKIIDTDAPAQLDVLQNQLDQLQADKEFLKQRKAVLQQKPDVQQAFKRAEEARTAFDHAKAHNATLETNLKDKQEKFKKARVDFVSPPPGTTTTPEERAEALNKARKELLAANTAHRDHQTTMKQLANELNEACQAAVQVSNENFTKAQAEYAATPTATPEEQARAGEPKEAMNHACEGLEAAKKQAEEAAKELKEVNDKAGKVKKEGKELEIDAANKLDDDAFKQFFQNDGGKFIDAMAGFLMKVDVIAGNAKTDDTAMEKLDKYLDDVQERKDYLLDFIKTAKEKLKLPDFHDPENQRVLNDKIHTATHLLEIIDRIEENDRIARQPVEEALREYTYYGSGGEHKVGDLDTVRDFALARIGVTTGTAERAEGFGVSTPTGGATKTTTGQFTHRAYEADIKFPVGDRTEIIRGAVVQTTDEVRNTFTTRTYYSPQDKVKFNNLPRMAFEIEEGGKKVELPNLVLLQEAEKLFKSHLTKLNPAISAQPLSLNNVDKGPRELVEAFILVARKNGYAVDAKSSPLVAKILKDIDENPECLRAVERALSSHPKLSEEFKTARISTHREETIKEEMENSRPHGGHP